MNVYKYRVTAIIPNMIKLDDDFWPEDLYNWTSRQIGYQIDRNAYELNSIIVNELGYSGWFFDTKLSNEYVFSKSIIDNYLELVYKQINDPTEPDEESHCIYHI